LKDTHFPVRKSLKLYSGYPNQKNCLPFSQ